VRYRYIVIVNYLIKEPSQDNVLELNELYLNAFPDNEGEAVSRLAIDFLINYPEDSISIACFDNQKIIGHIAFSQIISERPIDHKAFILAPLAVSQEFQGKGVGAKLVNEGLNYLIKNEVDTVCVYGDPNFYSRFGFETSKGKDFVPPYKLSIPNGWQAKSLSDNRLKEQFRFSCIEPLMNENLW
jgi:putative acetyltransferase